MFDRTEIEPQQVESDSGSARHQSIEGKILAKKYRIQSILGRGGFGVTLLAQNIHLPGKPFCAIKKLSPGSSSPGFLAAARWRFYQEAKSLSRLSSHAGVPALLDYFRIGTNLYLVEAYIPGQNLAQIVGSQRKFSELEVEKFLIQMLHLLEYIHSHRLIHRDIKPQNIILCQTDCRFVLIDFGAVKDLEPPSLARQNSSIVSRAIGTPGFAPPEQLSNRAVYSSDIYGLGMTCIYLLTGKEPIQLPTDRISCELIWSDEIQINVELREIISKMTKISLIDRYQSATQVITALDNRAVRAKLRTYINRKRAIANNETSDDSPIYYPPAVYWALDRLDL